ncbi:hypothetical protein [Flavobacterium soli]|uniref:hypothetical protein n=1 Tax=Flavobacterium soli TaxID=344881 RepID=UPI00040AB75A|nr:hypothetical protein [Flavobacterium soli]
MKTNPETNAAHQLVKDVSQAQTVLEILLEPDEMERLEKGAYALEHLLQNPKIPELLHRYAELLHEHELETLLSDPPKLEGVQQDDWRKAGLIACVQLLLPLSHVLLAPPDPNDDSLELLRYVLGSIPCSKLVAGLHSLGLEIMGVDYHLNFQQHLRATDTEQYLLRLPKTHPELKEHLELIAWLALIRLFLEAVYLYAEATDNATAICQND